MRVSVSSSIAVFYTLGLTVERWFLAICQVCKDGSSPIHYSLIHEHLLKDLDSPPCLCSYLKVVSSFGDDERDVNSSNLSDASIFFVVQRYFIEYDVSWYKKLVRQRIHAPSSFPLLVVAQENAILSFLVQFIPLWF